MHEGDLLVTLAVAVAGAALAGALAARLRLSPIVGYLVVGLAIGPFTPGFVADVEAINQLAEVGVSLLLFSLGVQLSFGELLQVRRVALIGGGVQVALCLGLGAGFTLAIARPWPEALLVGAFVAISSSAVMSKLLAERGEEDSPPARIALGWSVTQDLATIIFVVALGVIGSGELSGASVGLTLLKAVSYTGGLILLGLRVFPWLLNQVARLGSTELFVVAVAGLALGTATLAPLFDISLALGAFLTGLVLSESDLAHQVFGQVRPTRDLFAALFFVSIGLLVEPVAVLTAWPVVLGILAIIVLAKGLLSAGLSLVLGYRLPVALRVGANLAQCGEFSFVLASLGLSLGLITRDDFAGLLAAAVISIVLAPVVLDLTDRLATRRWVRGFGQRGALGEEEAELASQRGHAVLVGYGRIGQVIALALARRGFRYVVIEQDRRRVEALRRQGESVLYGDAANRQLLKAAGLAGARTLVIAIPDPIATRQIVELAQTLHPRIDIVARAASSQERAYLLDQNVREVVLPEQEAALEIARHTLQRFGLATMEVQAIIQGLRHRGEGMEP